MACGTVRGCAINKNYYYENAVIENAVAIHYILRAGGSSSATLILAGSLFLKL